MSNTLTKNNLDLVFKAYDVRGETPSQLDEPFFSALGKAFATYLHAKKIIVGRDIRTDSVKFQNAFIHGALSAGCEVIDIGEVATEMLYFAVGDDQTSDGGAVITASHNPSGWNGCKMVGKGSIPISGEAGFTEIKKLILSDHSSKSNVRKIARRAQKRNIYPGFKQKVFSFIGATTIKPLKIVVDAGNGVGGKIFDYLFSGLQLDVTKMYFQPDGSFPNHDPDPSKEENVTEIIKKTVELGADIGIALDGDADRVFFIDNRGRHPSGAYTGTIIARHFLRQHPGEKIIHCPRLKWVLTKEIKKAGGVPVVSKIGHTNFKKLMREANAIFAPEASSHFYYRDFYYCDSAMITIATMLRLLSEGLDFDKEMDYIYKTYPNSGEVNYVVKTAASALTKIENSFVKSGHIVDHLDGISIDFKDWRFNLRGSNTQPLLRLNVEGKTKEAVIKGFRKIEKMISGTRDNVPGLAELLT